MRMSLKGKAAGAFVMEAWLNGSPVWEVWHEGVRLYPDDRIRVKGLVLDVPGGSLEAAYWAHAQQAVLEGEPGEKLHMSMSLCGRVYALYAPYGDLPVVRAVNGVLTFAEDEGPLLSEVWPGAGACAVVQAVVPQRSTPDFCSPAQNRGVEWQWEARWLPGTVLMYSHYKGQKKVCSWAYGSVTGQPSGLVYIKAPNHIHEGHKRISWSWHSCGAVSGLEPDYADSSLKVVMHVGGSSGINACRLVFPAFERSWALGVKGVTLQ